MPVETEAKLRVSSHEPLRARLLALGARRVGSVLETNHIFDSPTRSLLANDQGLRVRRIETIDGAGEPATLTYKGPRDAGLLKRRREIELVISDAEAARAMLAALGFQEVLTFQKRRERWRLEACRIELDELPHLGCFIEVEGPDVQNVQDVLERLGLGNETIVPQSYIAMLIDFCHTHGLPADRIDFSPPGPVRPHPDRPAEAQPGSGHP